MTTTIEAFTGPLAGYRRVVIKIGSALLVEGRTGTPVAPAYFWYPPAPSPWGAAS